MWPRHVGSKANDTKFRASNFEFLISMSVVLILILASLSVALLFLGGFIWAVRSGQFEDTLTPSMRILTDDAVLGAPQKMRADGQVVCSAGTTENSPAFQCRVRGENRPSPEGAAEPRRVIPSAPSGLTKLDRVPDVETPDCFQPSLRDINPDSHNSSFETHPASPRLARAKPTSTSPREISATQPKHEDEATSFNRTKEQPQPT